MGWQVGSAVQLLFFWDKILKFRFIDPLFLFFVTWNHELLDRWNVIIAALVYPAPKSYPQIFLFLHHFISKDSLVYMKELIFFISSLLFWVGNFLNLSIIFSFITNEGRFYLYGFKSFDGINGIQFSRYPFLDWYNQSISSIVILFYEFQKQKTISMPD